jgi:hypothetical protein
MVIGATGSGIQPSLPRCIKALELGDWFAALSLSSPAATGPATLATVLNMLAASMQSRAAGDVSTAWRQLSEVASRLPRAMRHLDGTRNVWLADLRPLGDGDAWRVSRITWREQRELGDLRQRLSRDGTRPRDELVEACIERLGWVEFNPWTWSQPNGDLSVTPSRDELLRRGTWLRQFARPRSGRLSQSVWRDIGAYGGLYASALTRLAIRPVVPWDIDSGVPIRVGRMRIWDHAQQWRSDIAY